MSGSALKLPWRSPEYPYSCRAATELQFSACHQGERVAEDFHHGLIGGMHSCRFHYEICP